MITSPHLRAPFPYYGGKSKVVDLVWSRLGNVDNYIEPCCGSAVMLLRRPMAGRIETINDKDCMVANFWRAVRSDPEQVAHIANWPVNEADLHARHRWLVLSDEAKEFRRRIRREPEYFDPKIAGWWVWGMCCWIGGGWCTPQGETADGGRKQTIPAEHGKGVIAAEERRPSLSNGNGAYGPGVRRKPEHEWEQRPRIEGQGISQQMPDISGEAGASGRGIHASAGHKKRPALGDGNGSAGAKGVTREPPAARSSRIQLADEYSRGRGVHGHDVAENCSQRESWLVDWFAILADRLRPVRVCCGHWLRVCDSPSVTVRLGSTGVFFDPPYGTSADRDMNLYAEECGKIAGEIRDYCVERGDDPSMRLVLCGYEGEGHDVLVKKHGWSVESWEAQGGYGNRGEKGRKNKKRERIYFSPHCLSQSEHLFSLAGGAA